MLREWDKLPKNMRTEDVRPYYESLKKKKVSLALKRAFDVIASTIMIVILSPLLIIISVLIVTDSKGGVFIVKKELRSMVRNSGYLSSERW